MGAPGTQQLLDLLSDKPTELELDRAALEIARIEDPDLDADRYLSLLDRYAFEIADRAEDLSDGEKFVQTANAYLFGECHLRGNRDNYYDSSNSFLNRVLDTGLGIPITLSLVYMEVARRLAKPVYGIGLPGHFVIRYDDGEYATWIDPFHGGMLIDADGCRGLAHTPPSDEMMVTPVDRRTIAMRILNNLRRVYFSNRESAKALRLVDLLIAANPDLPEEHKQRGVALMHLRRVSEAVAAFRRYMELAPNAPDKGQIQEQIRSLSHWLAARN